MNKSPLRYPGGKTRACKTLGKVFEHHFSNNTGLATGLVTGEIKPFDYLYSPFFGGGSFEFYLQSMMKDNAVGPMLAAGTGQNEERALPFQILANDNFYPLYSF